ncbi:MAG: HEAT repeat domain-containing protein [Planctomycetes bacterium]|nr:HEAT repeat domain-containing protein [Planctomycetota bacterium]
MNEEPAFVAALVADPSDRTAALVFADWLDDRGDPRGTMLRNDEVRAWMAPTFENPFPRLRAAFETGKGVTKAGKICALIGEPAVPELLLLLTHATPIVRLRAVKTLRLMGARARAAVPALLEMVKGTKKEDADARREAIGLLGVLRVKGAAADELAKGLDSADPAERLAAVEAMSSLRTKAAGDSLCKALADPSADVRRAAAGQLRWIAGPSMPFAVEPLRKALAAADERVRRFALLALGKIGPKAAAAVPAVLRVLNGTATGRKIVIEALAQIGGGNAEVLEALLAELRNPDTQELAIGALAGWPTLPAAAAPVLLAFVRKPNSGTPYRDNQLSRLGLQAFARVVPPPPEVLEEFRAQLTKGHASAVAKAVGEIGPAAAPLLPDLVAALHRGGSDAYEIATAIGRIGGAGIAALTEALDREPAASGSVPLAAAGGLKEAGPAARSALPALVALLARFRRTNLPLGLKFLTGAIVATGPDGAVAVPDMVAMFLDEDCPNHYAHSLGAALRAFGPAVLPFGAQLAEALRRPGDGRTHERIIEVLAALIPHGFDALPALRAVLRRAIANDSDAGEGYPNDYRRRAVAGAAIGGLAALGPAAEEALPDLVLADQTFDGSELRERVLAAYGAIGAAAVPHIRAALTHPQRDVRLAAIRALAASGDAAMESQDALRKLEADAVRIVRATATSALRNMGTRKKKRS